MPLINQRLSKWSPRLLIQMPRLYTKRASFTKSLPLNHPRDRVWANPIVSAEGFEPHTHAHCTLRHRDGSLQPYLSLKCFLRNYTPLAALHKCVHFPPLITQVEEGALLTMSISALCSTGWSTLLLHHARPLPGLLFVFWRSFEPR